MKLTFSWRYGVVGFYVDRGMHTLHIYPLPFVRITVEY